MCAIFGLSRPAVGAQPGACLSGPQAAADRNAGSLTTLVWSPFGRPAQGWSIYAPLIAHEVGDRCPAGSPTFAADLAAWQGAHHLAGNGVFDPATFAVLTQIWFARRPFVAQSRIACPDAPAIASLVRATAAESYGGKTILLAPAALAAYRLMTSAARRESAAIAADPALLTIFSGFRAPADDAARCARELNCNGVTRGACSAHRTGLALDLTMGAAAGFRVDSSDDANRAVMVASPAYLWMVWNAARFGFVNYAFEPWHWEYVGAGVGGPAPGAAAKG